MDGATHVSTAALVAYEPAAGWCALARRTHTDSRGQARVLLQLIDDMLAETGRVSADIAAVVTGIGPGTFTGVRIAVATARALALALEVPVLGVSTLAALVAEAASPGGLADGAEPELIVPVVDARRGQVFYALYRRVAGGGGAAGAGAVYARTAPFAVCDRDALFSNIPVGVETAVVGDVGVLEAAASGAAAPENVRLHALEVRAENLVVGQEGLRAPEGPSAGSQLIPWLEYTGCGMAREPGMKAGDPGSPEAVKPIYVRSPDADIHITKMRDPWAETAPGT
jgi:tRNA threonylcarbamoyladenosine biosynthesis protein TsaB